MINNGFPRFGILVIPDYKLGTDGIILSRLGKQGIQNIQDQEIRARFHDRRGSYLADEPAFARILPVQERRDWRGEPGLQEKAR